MGKGGQKAVKASIGPEPTEILLDGKYIDISEFLKRHPGGNVIKFYMGNGIDSTQAFRQFHIRSKKATKIMESMPSRDADTKVTEKNLVKGQRALLDDFEKLTDDLKAEGFFKPAPLHIFYRVAELIVLHAIGIYCLFNSHAEHQMPIAAFGVAMLGIASGRCGWLMHEGGHYSMTGYIPVDKMLQVVIYGVGCGMSGGWWRNQHNKHHAMPQKAEHDVDLNTLPLVAFTTKMVHRAGTALKGWIRLQAYLFPICTTLLVTLGWQVYLHPRHVMRTKNVSEFVALATRYALWHHYVTGHFGLAASTGLYLAYNWCAANYIFINFAVSHTHLPVVPKEDTQVDWVRYAAIHTMNVNSGPFRFVDWWMSFLNYQIEHHLWPSMPQYHHPQTSLRVQALFKKHGLHYDTRDYMTAIGDTFENLDKVGEDVFYG